MIIYLNILKKFGFDSFLIKKSVVVRLYLEEDRLISFKEKLTVYVAFLFYPIYFILKLKKSKTKDVILRVGDISEKEYQMRSYFINKYTKSDANYDVVDGQKILYSSLSLRNFIKVVKVWWKFFLILNSLLNLKKDKNNLKSLFLVLNSVVSLCLINSKDKEVYTFQLFDTRNYLPSVLTELYPQLKFNLVTSGSIIFATNRYIFSPIANIIYCSSYQKSEIENYIARNWIVCKSHMLWGLEEAIQYDKVAPSDPICEVSIYSSGEWARREGIFRVKEYDLIKKGEFLKNDLYLQFEEIVTGLSKIVKQENLKLKVYLHPYEKFLFHEYSLVPPFIKILDNELNGNYQIDYEDENSISKIYESKLGVSLLSTAISDRWHLGLEGVMIENNETTDLSTYIGEYGNSVFKNVEDLLEYLKSRLSK